MLKDDLSLTYRLMKGSRRTKFMKMCKAPGVRAVIVFRFGSWLLTKPLYVRFFLKPFQVILQRRMMSKWGIEIHPTAKIGKGFRISHYGGIFIGEVVIGEDFLVSHDVTIGLAGTGERRGAPTIGDNVYVAPGAKIAGKIRIGNNAKIGTNAFVNRDVPDYALVQVRAPQIVVFPAYAGSGEGNEPGEEDDN
jgi:serine O-acetyltransferase